MPDVLLGQAYYLRFDPKLWQAQQPYAPLGTLYAASYLRERGHDVALFDAMLAQSVREWGRALDRASTARRRHLRRQLQLPDQDVPAAHARGRADDDRSRARARRADRRVRIGRDRSSRAVPAPRRRRRDPRRGRGHARRSRRSAAHRRARSTTCRASPISTTSAPCAAPARGPFIKSLDDLPFPAWDLVDVDRYRPIWHGRHGYHAMNVATTRGCPYHCNWCAKPIYGQRYAVRSPQTVVDEIAWLKRDFAPDQLSIVDDVFGLQPGWVEEFAALVNETERARAVPLPDARRSSDAERRAGARRCRLPDGVDGRRVGLAARPRRDGEGPARRADPRAPTAC